MPRRAAGVAAVGTGQAKKLSGRPGRQKRTTVICQVPGCGVELIEAKGYYRRYRICFEHCSAPAITINGSTQRFCQQCGRFQPLCDFDGEKKSCRQRLKCHNERRRATHRARGHVPMGTRARRAKQASTPSPIVDDSALEEGDLGEGEVPEGWESTSMPAQLTAAGGSVEQWREDPFSPRAVRLAHIDSSMNVLGTFPGSVVPCWYSGSGTMQQMLPPGPPLLHGSGFAPNEAVETGHGLPLHQTFRALCRTETANSCTAQLEHQVLAGVRAGAACSVMPITGGDPPGLVEHCSSPLLDSMLAAEGLGAAPCGTAGGTLLGERVHRQQEQEHGSGPRQGPVIAAGEIPPSALYQPLAADLARAVGGGSGSSDGNEGFWVPPPSPDIMSWLGLDEHEGPSSRAGSPVIMLPASSSDRDGDDESELDNSRIRGKEEPSSAATCQLLADGYRFTCWPIQAASALVKPAATPPFDPNRLSSTEAAAPAGPTLDVGGGQQLHIDSWDHLHSSARVERWGPHEPAEELPAVQHAVAAQPHHQQQQLQMSSSVASPIPSRQLHFSASPYPHFAAAAAATAGAPEAAAASTEAGCLASSRVSYRQNAAMPGLLAASLTGTPLSMTAPQQAQQQPAAAAAVQSFTALAGAGRPAAPQFFMDSDGCVKLRLPSLPGGDGLQAPVATVPLPLVLVAPGGSSMQLQLNRTASVVASNAMLNGGEGGGEL